MIPHATRALGKDGFLGSELEWTVPEQTPKGLSLNISSPKALPAPLRPAPSAQTHPTLGHCFLLRGRRGCTLRKEASAGDASTRGPEYLVISLGPLGLRVRPPSFGCTLDSGHSQGKPGKTLIRGVSMKGTLLAPVQPWDSILPRFQGSDTIPNYRGQWA